MAYSVENDEMHPSDRLNEELKTANILKACELILTFYRDDPLVKEMKSWNGQDIRHYLLDVVKGKTISEDGLFTEMLQREEREEQQRQWTEERGAKKAAAKAGC